MSPGFFSVWYDRRQGKFVNLCHIVIPKWKTINLKSRSILTKYSNRLTDWCIVKSLVLRKKVAYFEEIGMFLQHFAKNWVKTPTAWYFAQKVASFEEIDMFLCFFTKCQ